MPAETDASVLPAARPRRKRRVTALGVLALLTLAVVLGCGVAIWQIFANSTNFLFSTRPDVTLQNFVGMTKDEFLAGDFAKKLETELTEGYNAAYGAGVIYQQAPGPGRTVKEGQRITLKVSLGAKKVSLPDLRETPRDEALQTLRDSGLTVVTSFVQDNTLPDGTILRTEPAAGETVEGGSVVTVYLSCAQVDPIRTVPALTGVTVAEARRRLESIGLRAETSAPDDATVTGQDPMQGMPLRVANRVQLYT